MHKRLKDFRDWCPQPPNPLPTKLKQYTVPIAIMLTATLLAASFSIFYSVGVFNPSVPTIPIVNIPSSTSSSFSSSATPAVEWEKVLPGGLGISATCIIQTSDGGYAVGGDCDFNTGAGGYLVKLDSSGNMQWNQSYVKYAVSIYSNSIEALVQTKDGGYAFLLGDSCLIKTNSEGKIQWNVTFNSIDLASRLVQTSDAGYAVSGDEVPTQPENGHYESNFWLAKYSPSGASLWNNTYSGLGFIAGGLLVQCSDGGFTLAGTASGIEDEFTLAKTDSSGNLLWYKTFAGAGMVASAIQASDGGFVLGGSDGSNVWLLKTDSSGNLQWTQTYAGNVTYSPPVSYYGWPYPNFSLGAVIQTSDGGLAFTGYAPAQYEPNNEAYFSQRAWLVKTDSDGNVQWNETFGAVFYSFAGNALIETKDGGFAVAGYSQQPGGEDTSGNYYVVKTEPALTPPISSSPPSSSSVPPANTLPLEITAAAILSSRHFSSVDCLNDFTQQNQAFEKWRRLKWVFAKNSKILEIGALNLRKQFLQPTRKQL